MATKTLSNEFMQRIADEGAWKEISGDLCWTEQLLEKYQDKIDWNELSENRNIDAEYIFNAHFTLCISLIHSAL